MNLFGAEEFAHGRNCEGCSDCEPAQCATCGAVLTELEVEASATGERRDDCYRCAEPETVETRTLSDAELVAEREEARARREADCVTYDLDAPAAIPSFKPEWERQLNARGFSRFSRGSRS